MLIWNKIWNKVHTINCYPKNIFQSKTFHNRSIDYHNEQNISNFNVHDEQNSWSLVSKSRRILKHRFRFPRALDNTENQARVDGEMKKHYIY